MADADGLLVVRCECGWEARGDADTVVALVSKHASEVHNMRSTREQILSRAEPA